MKNYNAVLIIGFGASSLNMRALISSITRTKIPFHYLDTFDPIAVKEILGKLDLKKSAIFIISKSGETQETNILAEYLFEQDIQNVFVLCSNKNSTLYKIVSKFDHEWIDYANVKSGRFALLTKPFLDIAEIAGVNSEKINYSALNVNIQDAEIIADKWLQHFNKGRYNWVVMIYTRQVYGLFLWVRQIVSESLGKNAFGIFPVIVEGTMDEHSQLQLFLDGPDDKFYDIISCGFSEIGFEKLAAAQVDHAYKISSMLIDKKREVEHVHHEFIDEKVIGQYIATYTEAIKIIGRKMNFDPLTQPAVESMKQKSYEN